MQLQHKPIEKESFTVIVGCGRLGANLANAFSDEGRGVIILDLNRAAFSQLSPTFGGIILTGDATDIDVLNEAKMGGATGVIAVTNSDNTNIMVAQMAKELYHVKRVVARLYDPDRECVYREFGIQTISPILLSTKLIRQFLDKSSSEGLK